MNRIKLWVIALAIVGSAISYSSIYAFHIALALWVALAGSGLIMGYNIRIQQAHLLYPLFIFTTYSFFTVAFHPNILVWARYQFYLTCGLLSILAVYQYTQDIKSLCRAFNVIAIFMAINIGIGLLESIEVFRWPTSRYSPYLHYFGYASTELENLSAATLEVLANKPTGFNFNPNNFGFVMMLAAPFFVFHKRQSVKLLGLIAITWLLFSIGSRTHFVALLLLIALIPFYIRMSYGAVMALMLAPICVATIVALPQLIEISSYDAQRMYSAFDAIKTGTHLMLTGDIDPRNSTSTRAYIYLFGISQLIQSYGIGLGFGGIEALLIESNFNIQLFHFFFLQLLVDMGVLMFSLTLYFYFVLIIKLRNIAFNSNDANLSYFARASSLALCIAIPASVSPSGVHYILAFYILLGFSLSILKVNNDIKNVSILVDKDESI